MTDINPEAPSGNRWSERLAPERPLAVSGA